MTKNASQKAQTLVEFTLLIVLLLLIMAGSVDVARAVTVYTFLDNAAQEGAVYGVMAPTDTTQIEQRVQDTVKSWIRDPANDLDIAILYHTQPCPGHLIEVRVRTQLPLTFPLANLFIPSRELTLEASAHQMILASDDSRCTP